MTFYEWLLNNSNRVYEDLNISPDNLIIFLEDDCNNIPMERYILHMMSAHVWFAELEYGPARKYIDVIINAYKEDYKEYNLGLEKRDKD